MVSSPKSSALNWLLVYSLQAILIAVLLPSTIWAQAVRFASTPSPAYQATDVELSYKPGMVMGRGYNSLTGNVAGDCITLTKEPEGAAISYEIFEGLITNKSELAKELLISASASASLGFADVSGKTEFFRKVDVSTYKSNLVVHEIADTGWQNALDVKLKDEFAQLADSNLYEFKKKCGDRFIGSMKNGGELVGIAIVDYENAAEQSYFDAEIGFDAEVFSGDSQIVSDVQEKLESKNTKYNIYVYGGSRTEDVDLSREGLQAKLATFHQEVGETGGFPVYVKLQDYTVLPNYPGESLLTGSEQNLNRLWDLRLKYATLIEDVNYILDNPKQFLLPYGLSGLLLVKDDIDKQILLIDAALALCINSDGDRCESPQIKEIDSFYDRFPVRYQSTCGETRLDLPVLEMLPLQHTGGDSDIKGNNPSIEMTARLTGYGGSGTSRTPGWELLRLNVALQITEGSYDWTEFTGFSRPYVFDLPIEEPHCAFANSFAEPMYGQIRATGGKNNHDVTKYSGSGLIDYARCLSDTNDDDRGQLGCLEIVFVPVTLNLLHVEDLLFYQGTQSALAPGDRLRGLLDRSFTRSSLGEISIDDVVKPSVFERRPLRRRPQEQ